MWSSRKASSRDEAAVTGGLIVYTAYARILVHRLDITYNFKRACGFA